MTPQTPRKEHPMMSCCATCGEPCDGTYCTDHRPHRPDHRRGRPHRRTDLGTTAWMSLSRRARAAQPFCTCCGSTDQLAADHSPRAWARTKTGHAIRLADITVLCQHCNLAAGSSQPGSSRYNQWATNDGNLNATTPDTTLPRWGDTPTKHSPASTARPRITLSDRCVNRCVNEPGGLEGVSC